MSAQDFTIPPPLGRAFHRVQQRSLIVGGVALVICVIGALFSPDQFFRSYLFSYLFYLGMTLGCMALVMLQYLSGGSWGIIIRRITESATRTIPLLAFLFLPILIGIPKLYSWSHDEVVKADPLLQHKHLYLNVPFFIVRVLIYFIGWWIFAHFLNKWSHEQDTSGRDLRGRRLQLLSGPGLIFYALSVTFASVDWVMSLEPDWFSTIFGLLFVAGQGLSALSLCIAVLVILSDDGGPLEGVIGPSHLHDIGKLLLAFTMLWAYFSFSQFLIIWAGNLVDEIPWYLKRLRGGWEWIALLLVVFPFRVPVRHAALPKSKTGRPQAHTYRRTGDRHAVRRSVLDRRAGIQPRWIPRALDGFSRPSRNRRLVAGRLLVSTPEVAAAACPGSAPGRSHRAGRST